MFVVIFVMLRFFIDKCEFDIDVIFDFLYCDVYWL